MAWKAVPQRVRRRAARIEADGWCRCNVIVVHVAAVPGLVKGFEGLCFCASRFFLNTASAKLDVWRALIEVRMYRCQAITAEDIERLAWLREYYESGCLCIRDGVLIRVPAEESDVRAIASYEHGCKCSRHPDWPRNRAV